MEEFEPPKKERSSGYGPISAVLVTIAVYFTSQLFVGIILGLWAQLPGWDSVRVDQLMKDSVLAQFVAVLIIYGLTLWLIWRFLRYRRVPLRTIGLIPPQVRDIGYALLGYAAYFALFIGITIAAQQLVPGLNLDQEQQIGFSKETTGPALWLIFVSLVILPPVTEEIVTRGFLYTGLRSKLPKVTAAIITSLMFAAAHLQWGSGNALLWVAALDTFVLSLILVYLREKTGSLWSPIMVHMFKNCLAFTLLFILKTV